MTGFGRCAAGDRISSLPSKGFTAFYLVFIFEFTVLFEIAVNIR